MKHAFIQYALLLCLLILSAQIVVASGSISTTQIVPPQKTLCGPSLPTVETVTASGITNIEQVALGNVIATLNVVPASGGISIVTGSTRAIGNLSPSQSFSSNLNWTIQCNTNYPGNYTLFVTYNTENGFSASSLDQAVAKINVSPAQDLNSPVIANPLPNGVIGTSLVKLSVSTNEPSFCRYDPADSNTFSGNTFDSFFVNGYSNVHFATLNGLGEGAYTYFVRCADPSNNFQKTATKISFTTDFTPPRINDFGPTRVTISYALVNVTTNEDSTCRYSRNASTSFNDMTLFFQGSQLVHTTQMSGFGSGTNSVYVKCRDTAGNAMITDYDGQIVYDAAPTAEVSTERQSPFKPGVIGVSLITSVTLPATPKLTFLIEGQEETIIVLTGEGKTWQGYMVIPAAITTEKVGTFRFSGIDDKGVAGSSITKGSVFLVDPTPPKAPAGLRITQTEKGITLTWKELDDVIDFYQVYRADHSNVTLEDYYTIAKQAKLIDNDAKAANTYFYRVAAVDAAGNVGTLSDEINLRTADSLNNKIQGLNNPVPLTKINPEELQNVAKQLGLEIDTLGTDFKTARTETKDRAPDEAIFVDMIAKTRTGEVALEDLKKKIVSMDFNSADTDQYKTVINDIKVQINNLKRSTPKSIEILDKQIISLTPTEDMAKMAIQELGKTKGSNYSQKMVDLYLKKWTQDTSSIAIKADVRVVKVTYADNHEETVTLVRKEVNFPMAQGQSTVVIEFIPKSVLDDAAKIKTPAQTPTYDVIRADPVLKWRLNGAKTQELRYILPGAARNSDTANILTIPLPNTDALESGSNGITGFSIVKNIEQYTGAEGWLVILGVLLIVGLGGYYVYTGSETGLNGIPLTKPASNPILKSSKSSDQSPSESQDVSLKWQQATYYAEQGYHSQALGLYKELSQLNDRASQNGLYELYHKVLLGSVVQQAQQAIQFKQMTVLYQAVSQIQQILPQISSQHAPVCHVARQCVAYYHEKAKDMQQSRQVSNQAVFKKLKSAVKKR